MTEEPVRLRANTVEVRLADALEKSIQCWVAWSGRKVPIPEASWLEGPVGDEYIGVNFYSGYAREAGLEAVADEEVGLLPDFDALAGGGSMLPCSILGYETSTNGRPATTFVWG